MPTAISNALGTARQFTPQPDAMYQERLNGVSAFQHQTAQGISNADLIAANMQKLTNAMRSYDMAEEKRRDEWGLESATRMLNGMTADDIMKLDVIDAAQTAGYVNETDNPYFLAYSDKIRGEFLSTKARQEYDAKYAEAPAASTDEEVARYKEFSAQWLKDNVKAKNWNQTAFDKGFNENSLVNQTSIASEYTKKKLDESMKTLYANTRARLSYLAEAFPSMKKDELTAKVQEVLNEPRLMGLDVNLRFRLLDEFTQNMVKSGYIDAERLEQMAKNITIQTNMDGTKRTMYDFLDTHSLAVQANNYQAQFYTREQHGFIEEHKNDPNMDKTFQYLESIKNTDPQKYRRLAPYANNIKNMQIENARRREAERQKASLKAFNATAVNAYLEANYDAYINNKNFDAFDKIPGIPRIPDGKGDFRAPTEDEKLDYFKNKVAYVLNRNNQPDMSEETRMRYWMKVFNYEPFHKVKQIYVHDYESEIAGLNIDSLDRDKDGNVVVSANIETLVNAYKVDSVDFLNAFGNSLSKDVARIVRYTNSGGSLEAGVEAFAEENSIDPELKTRYQNEVRAQIARSAYTIDDMHTAGGGAMTTAWLNANEHASRQVEEQAARYRAHGYSTDAAVQMALEEVKKQSMYYHSAILPKSLFNGMGTTNDEAWATQVLDEIVYSVADEAGVLQDASEVNVVWNSDNSMFTFAYGGTVRYLSLADIRERAYKKAKDAEAAGMALPDSSVTADDINAARDQYVIGVDEDRDTYPDMSFQGGD